MKKSIVANTLTATVAFVMMTTVAPAKPIPITSVNAGEPLIYGVLSDARAANWFKFRSLMNEWKNHRGVRSSISEISAMPAYQSIIGMGENAVPLIIAQLKLEGDDPDQWFWALKAITQVDPVKPHEKGDFRLMALTWIKWAEDQDYVG